MQIVRRVQLTPQQVRDALDLKQLFDSWLRAVHTDRRKLTVMLSELVGMGRYGNVYAERYMEGMSGAVLRAHVISLSQTGHHSYSCPC